MKERKIIMKFYNSKLRLAFLVAVIVGSVILTGWAGSAFGITKKDLRRVDDQGAVEVTVVYLNPLKQGDDSKLLFDVSMETHSVNLEAYKMQNISFVRFDDGKKKNALGWLKPGGGGHHISGTLQFPGPIPDGAKSLQVVIEGIDGISQRVFEWKLPVE